MGVGWGWGGGGGGWGGWGGGGGGVVVGVGWGGGGGVGVGVGWEWGWGGSGGGGDVRLLFEVPQKHVLKGCAAHAWSPIAGVLYTTGEATGMMFPFEGKHILCLSGCFKHYFFERAMFR